MLMKREDLWVVASVLLLSAGCTNATTAPRTNVAPVTGLRAVEVVSGLSSPVHLTAPAGDGRLFVVEQAGRIRIVESGALRTQPFLDISGKISSGGERGLLSVAFDPQYATTGYFWVNFTDPGGNTRVERYRVSSNPNVADPASSTLVIAIDQPYANHNGGQLAFGPDGMLFIGMGDGGSGGDPQNNAQNRASLLGKMLRLDVRSTTPYVIPTNNPWRNTAGARAEIWSYGLRNPWRFSFDRGTGMLYIADVGQGKWEEIDAVSATSAPLNFGWRLTEGPDCYNPSNCDRTGITPPVLSYSHDDGCSVTGGYVYRGTRLAGLEGRYFYSDYCGGWLRSFVFANGVVTEQKDWGIGAVGGVQSFGEDASGELYILSSNGRVYRIEAAPAP